MPEQNDNNLSSGSLFIIGLFLLFTPLVFIIIFPGAYDAAQFYLRLTASLGGAMIGAFIPGTLHINTSWARATGALGIFVLVFTFNPSWDVYYSVDEKLIDTNEHINATQTHNASSIDSADTSTGQQTQFSPTTVSPIDISACVAQKVGEYEQAKSKSTEGGARAPGPGIGGGTKKSSVEVCISAGPNQEIIDGYTNNLSCFGGRCSVSAVRYSSDHREACVTTNAWSESKSFGGGGSGQYRLTINYKNKATESDLQRFQDECM